MVEPGTTGLPVPGTSVFFTVKFGTGFVTVDVQALGAMHGPVVMVAVFFTLVVSVADTLAVKVTLTEWPAARVTLMVTWLPVTVAVQASPVASVVHFKVPAVMARFEAMVSPRVAEPAPEPVFFTVIV